MIFFQKNNIWKCNFAKTDKMISDYKNITKENVLEHASFSLMSPMICMF